MEDKTWYCSKIVFLATAQRMRHILDLLEDVKIFLDRFVSPHGIWISGAMMKQAFIVSLSSWPRKTCSLEGKFCDFESQTQEKNPLYYAAAQHVQAAGSSSPFPSQCCLYVFLLYYSSVSYLLLWANVPVFLALLKTSFWMQIIVLRGVVRSGLPHPYFTLTMDHSGYVSLSKDGIV